MTKYQKIIRAKVGVLGLAKQPGNVQPSVQVDGLQPGRSASRPPTQCEVERAKTAAVEY